MSSAAEFRFIGLTMAASAALAHGEGKPVYVSWTLHETPGGGLRSGETVGRFRRVGGFQIFDARSCLPVSTARIREAIEVGLRDLLDSSRRKPIGCYPNRLNKVPEGWTLDNEITTGLRRDLPRNIYAVSAIAPCPTPS